MRGCSGSTLPEGSNDSVEGGVVRKVGYGRSFLVRYITPQTSTIRESEVLVYFRGSPL